MTCKILDKLAVAGNHLSKSTLRTLLFLEWLIVPMIQCCIERIVTTEMCL